jgi:hypothetical protein
MPGIWERIQNLWRNDLERQRTELESEAKQAGRNEVVQQLTDNLAALAQELRDDWAAAAAVQNSGSFGVSDAYYQGRIETYNRIAYLIHEMDNEGSITVDTLPEVLHAEGIGEGMHRTARTFQYERARKGSVVETRELDPSEQPADRLASWGTTHVVEAALSSDLNAAEPAADRERDQMRQVEAQRRPKHEVSQEQGLEMSI